MFDVNQIRKDFPILREQVYGKPLVYLDNGATTQKPRQVVEVMNEYYLRYNSNVHRGVHYLSNRCTDANERARATDARTPMSAPGPSCGTIFTREKRKR